MWLLANMGYQTNRIMPYIIHNGVMCSQSVILKTFGTDEGYLLLPSSSVRSSKPTGN
ncbi:hypothetical protein HOLleu_21942 [Holothuria leucospilota]|uniref:Uncharacterized protein n=1 Tax=Holothuria leucospilota TaxID=206669 RepID=A0A9Q1BY42_HOLLE|nr:hypothetical protein HOLleu_21942 [Holothuria leucospilota]